MSDGQIVFQIEQLLTPIQSTIWTSPTAHQLQYSWLPGFHRHDGPW